jgi:hypothetical protein
MHQPYYDLYTSFVAGPEFNDLYTREYLTGENGVRIRISRKIPIELDENIQAPDHLEPTPPEDLKMDTDKTLPLSGRIY